MPPESPTDPPEHVEAPVGAAPFGSPRAPLHRFSFEAPRLGWGFCMHGWTNCYLILWDGAVHDGDWFEQNRGKIVGRYDDWEGPHYGDAVVLHMVHLEPGVPHRDREGFEAEAIRKALQHLRNPIPLSPPAKPWFRCLPSVNFLLRNRTPAHDPLTAWLSVQCHESVDECVCEAYQALFLEPDGDRDLIRSACLLRLWEERFDPPESLRLDSLELRGWQDCCVEVSVPREAFRKAYYEAVFAR